MSIVAGLVRALRRRRAARGLRAVIGAAVEPTDTRLWVAADVLTRLAVACEALPAMRGDGTAAQVAALAHAVEDFPR